MLINSIPVCPTFGQHVRVLLIAIFFLCLVTPCSFGDDDHKLRKWTDDSGNFSILATYVKYVDNTVFLKRDDGATIEVPYDRLSKSDRKYITDAIAAAKKNEADSETHARPALLIGDCSKCNGLGITPLVDFKPYIHFTHKRQRNDVESIGFCACPKCQANRELATIDPRVINDPDDNRTDQWKDLLGGKLRAVETHYYLIHSQLDDKTTKDVAQSLEKMQRYLQESTGSMFFVPVRRSTHDIMLLRNKDNYLKFLERVKENRPPKNQDVDWSIMPKRTSSWLGPTQFTHNISKQSLPYVKNAVVGTAAYYQLGMATNWNANDWLVTGFAAHNEHNLFKENITYPVKYTFTDPKLNRNWNLILKSFVSQEKLEPWERMFERRIRDYQTIDYVQSKSMVDFLMAEPKKFLAFAMQIRDGVDQHEAIQKAYGQPLTELEARWKRSLQ